MYEMMLLLQRMLNLRQRSALDFVVLSTPDNTNIFVCLLVCFPQVVPTLSQILGILLHVGKKEAEL